MNKKASSITLAALTLCALSTSAATLTTGDATGTDWSGTNFQTIASTSADAGFDLKENNTDGVIQSFTATSNMTVGTISILAQRLAADKSFALDVYEFLPGDGGPTFGANPDKFRLTDPTRSTLLKSYSLQATTANDITAGARGENQFNVELLGAEQFDLVSGNTYGIHIYSTIVSGDTSRIMLWDYVNSDSYAGGTYGTDGNTVAARDLGLAITAIPAIPEPGSYAMIAGLLALSAIMIKRRSC